MYEDENNLYHYSYRKGDEQNPNAPIDTKNYAEDPWDKNPGGSPKKKGGSGLSGKIVALALVCALVGGFIGAGVSGAATAAKDSAASEDGAIRFLLHEGVLTVIGGGETGNYTLDTLSAGE